MGERVRKNDWERQRVSVKNKRKMGERESYITSVKERERGVWRNREREGGGAEIEREIKSKGCEWKF